MLVYNVIKSNDENLNSISELFVVNGIVLWPCLLGMLIFITNLNKKAYKWHMYTEHLEIHCVAKMSEFSVILSLFDVTVLNFCQNQRH